MTGPRWSGHVAHCSPGAVILTPSAVRLLARHLAARREPDDYPTATVVADLQRLYRASRASRDESCVQLDPEQSSEMTTAQAARRLGITPAGVRKRISRQQLPARYDGQRWHIDRDTIERHTA